MKTSRAKDGYVKDNLGPLHMSPVTGTNSVVCSYGKFQPGRPGWIRETLWTQHGRVVRTPDGGIWLKSVGPGLKSRSDRYSDVILGSPEFNFSATFVNSQLACLPPVRILSLVMFIWIFIYHCLFTLVLKSPNGEWPITRLYTYTNTLHVCIRVQTQLNLVEHKLAFFATIIAVIALWTLVSLLVNGWFAYS